MKLNHTLKMAVLTAVGLLSLNLAEMKVVRAYFKKKKKNPTDVELETVAQTWSEHCVHKTFRGIIDFDGRKIDNLLKTTIMRATAEAQSATLTFYAQKKKPEDPNNALKVKLTPAQFERMFDLLQSPLQRATVELGFLTA